MTMVDKAVKLLNELLARDRGAVEALLQHRVDWQGTIDDGPTVFFLDGDVVTLSMLGLINGIVADINQRLFVAANYEAICPEHGVVDQENGCCVQCGAKINLGRLLSFQSFTATPPADNS